MPLNQSTPVFDTVANGTGTGVLSGKFSLSVEDVPARLVATGLAGAETMTLFAIDGPADTATAVYKDGAAVSLKATDPVIAINAPGVYRVDKGATAGQSGAFLTKGGI